MNIFMQQKMKEWEDANLVKDYNIFVILTMK